MKVLIVDNGTRQLADVVRCVHEQGHNVLVERYSPFQSIDPRAFDCYVLTGGMIHEVNDVLANGEPFFRWQFELIRATNKPVLGICLGLQMLNVAFEGTLRHLSGLIETDAMPLDLDGEAADIFGTDNIEVFKRHQYALDVVAESLEVLAESAICPEVVRHTSRPIIGTQFHPEMYPEQFTALFDYATHPDRITSRTD